MNYYAVEKTTGKVKGIKSTPFVENFKCYAYESDLIFDIGDIFNPLGNEISRGNRRVEILKELEALELKQARPLRELTINPNSEIAINKIITIDNEIATLRIEYNSLGAL